jgi:enolase
MENKITKIKAEEIKDSRGNPTIKITVGVEGISASFSVPSGASTGVHEACELRDEDGRGVKDVINKVNFVIAQALIGQNVLDQKGIDKIMMELDGTPNKSNLGGNAIIGVSIACAKVAAKVSNMEVFEYLRTLNKIKSSRNTPYLYMNLINGGKHTKTDLAFQEYHIVPNTQDVSLAFEIGIKFQNSLKEIIKEEFGEESITLGDEGGFAVKTNDIRKPLEIFSKVLKNNGLEGKVRFAVDVASSSFYKDNVYKVGDKNISKEELKNIYDSLISEFNLLSIEDPFNEEDFSSFRNLKESQKNTLVVGDDLTVTNIILLKKAIENRSISAMIIKPNQIGTLSETLETMRLARENNIELIVSHRSGETDDDFIADLVYAFGCFGLKAGSPLKIERRVKYERLIKISKI